AAAAACVVEALQTGFLFAAKSIGMQLERVDPVQGVVRMGRSLKDIWRPALRGAAIVTVAAIIIEGALREAAFLFAGDYTRVEAWCFDTVQRFLGTMCALLAILGALEYFGRRLTFFKELSI